jgi:predicted enzyme related to lactoylglutathione lyase
MGNAVVHFDINGPDGALLEKFYGELFGWKMQPLPPEARYTLVDTQGGSGINGGIGTTRDGATMLAFYVEADDLQPIIDKAESLGATTVMPITEIPDMVTYALLADPDGLRFGIVKSGDQGEEGTYGPSQGDGAPVDWFEVMGSDPERTHRFYTELFGWKTDDSGFPGYRLVDTGAGRGAGGGLGGTPDGETWLTVYARVLDVGAVLARAEDLGGERVYGPNDVDDHMQTGAFRDPAGMVFGIYSHPDHD